MAMVRWDPFGEMMTVQRDMNRLFSSLGMPLYSDKGDGERISWMPSVDVLRKGDDLVIRAELPGVKPQDVDVSVTDDTLTIKGHRHEDQESREGDYLRKESTYGSFERQVMLPGGIDTSAVHADYRDGILEVVVPGAAKTSRPQTQHIPIGGAQSGRQMQAGQSQSYQEARGGTTYQGPQGGEGYEGRPGQQQSQTQQIRVGGEGGRQGGGI